MRSEIWQPAPRRIGAATKSARKRRKLSVVGILPTYNEERNVANAIRAFQAVPEFEEVVVVDGYSTDDTVRRAREAGARVVYQKVDTYPGKGWAIESALEATTQEVLVFFDADVSNVEPEMLRGLFLPILEDRYDHVLATFGRRGGRVTELTAKPLMGVFFPEIRFHQPLTGEFATRRRTLKQIEIIKDWGIESGLVIDLVMKRFRVLEVDIGFKEHDMKALPDLRIMAKQVARTVLDKAREYGRLRASIPELPEAIASVA